MGKFCIGILGAGTIANRMAEALVQLPALAEVEIWAVASRSMEKAQAFAEKYGIEKAYGDYESMVSDANVDLVYIATPHSHHYPHARLAIEHGKAILVEKSFMANAREAREILAMAKERGVYATEAMWTRYMPMSHKITELIKSGVIGTPRVLSATLFYMMEKKARLWTAELGGGALLDVGVYVLNFARMYFGSDIVRTVSQCIKGKGGMDAQESISLVYANGNMANLQAGAYNLNDRQGIISGTEGYIRVDNVNCPELIEVYRNYELVETITKPKEMISGLEYEVLEAKRCMEQGLLETPCMPHIEIIGIMEQMDQLRKEWGVVFPMD